MCWNCAQTSRRSKFIHLEYILCSFLQSFAFRFEGIAKSLSHQVRENVKNKTADAKIETKDGWNAQ